MSNFTAGQKVIWLYTPPGGYSYTQRVNATVIRCGPKRVLIECEMIRPQRKTVQRWVYPENLRDWS